jgi:hypothetical protein
MRKSRFQKILFGGALCLLLICVIGFSILVFTRAKEKISRSPAAAGAQRSQKIVVGGQDFTPHFANSDRVRLNSSIKQDSRVIKAINQKLGKGFFREYFINTILKSKQSQQLYKVVKQYLPKAGAEELMCMYIVEGPSRNGSMEFIVFMHQLQTELNSHAEEIANAILNHDSDLKSNAFIYQMVLNMIAAMDLPSKRKGELFGKAFEQQFSVSSNGKITPQSANITSALILMKRSGVASEDARSGIEYGFKTNASDNKSYYEFRARIALYYPDLAPTH